MTRLIPHYARGKKKYAKFIVEPKLIKKWKKAEDKSDKIIKEIKKKFNVTCFVVANMDYWQDHAFKIACRKNNIPVVVLQKEYPITKEVSDKFMEHYGEWNPVADVIAVAGEKSKDIYYKNGVSSHATVIVTGLPRLDRYRSIDEFKGYRDNKNVALLSFRNGYGLNAEEKFYALLGGLVGNLILPTCSGHHSNLVNWR